MKNRVVRISVDVDVNVNVDFENLEENVYNLLSQLGIVEAVVSSEDEEVDDNRMLTVDEANAATFAAVMKVARDEQEEGES